MEYVRYKLDKYWAHEYDDDTIKRTIKNGIYLFPYFLDDSYDEAFILYDNYNDNYTHHTNGDANTLNEDKSEWLDEFDWITKEEYLKETGIPEKTIDVINELLESNQRDNILIALEIYKNCKPNEFRYE